MFMTTKAGRRRSWWRKWRRRTSGSCDRASLM